MPVDEKEAMYIFNLRYMDYKPIDRFSFLESGQILSDQIILLGGVQNQAETDFRLIVPKISNERHTTITIILISQQWKSVIFIAIDGCLHTVVFVSRRRKENE
ncbi:mobile element protein [Sporolactobacillus inulinus]|uniref:Mobile element protein n=1 Tax=Sporolactobacillus inulinus TaxID=2078 RepID=A0A4Y1ZIA3_9BACL|nr:hypothetical protein [Sporolactobacillus inulinus]GAY78701.1 mobile element protein [Sporolactobacillus inulinus]